MEPSLEDIKRAHENSLVRKLLESPFILLAISLVIVISSYAIWGTIELFKVAPGVLPQ